MGYAAATNLASSSATPTTSTQVPASLGLSENSITLEVIQQIVISVLSTLGVSGKPSTAHSGWLLDSSVTNLMTHDPWFLSNLRLYTGSLHISTGNGNIFLFQPWVIYHRISFF